MAPGQSLSGGESPPYRTAAFSNPAIIKMLMDAGADASRKDANGDRPISRASWYLRNNDGLRLLTYESAAAVHQLKKKG